MTDTADEIRRCKLTNGQVERVHSINSSSSKTRKYSCVLILAQNRTRQSSAHARTMSRQTYIDDATMRIEVRCFFFSKP